MHPHAQTQLVAVELTDQVVVRCNDGTRHTFLLGRQEQWVTVVLDSRGNHN
ncbi:hypothetical protein D3C76_1086900 [compost metagenome]